MYPTWFSSKSCLRFLTFIFWSFLILTQAAPPFAPLAWAQEAAQPQSLFTLENTSDSALTLIPSIHLVPPGSTLVTKNKNLAELRAQTDGKELERLAMADINFFEGQLRKKLGPEAKLTRKNARFDVYQDFMGKKITDLLAIDYAVSKP